MPLLASVRYDPATAVTLSTAAALAMTAMDTTNLRLQVTAPASGKIKVVQRAVIHGATTFPQILFGVMSGSTVLGRCAPSSGLMGTALATTLNPVEAAYIIDGLTANQVYTLDMAYSVETAVSSTGVKYGGPNDATANNAFGQASFEAWQVT